MSAFPELLLQFYEVRGSLPAPDGTSCATEIQDLSLIAVALARVEGLVSAWLTCRAIVNAQPQDSTVIVQKQLFGTLLRLCFAPPDADMIRELLSLPLCSSEEAFLESYALESLDRAQGAVALDTLLIKFVNQGRYIDAIHLDRRATYHERTLTFSEQEQDTFSRAKQRRRALMDGVWAVVPSIQRNALLVQDSEDDHSLGHAKDQHREEMDMDCISKPLARPHTPLSVSLGSKDVQGLRKSSADVNLLRASIRVPTASSSEPRSASPVHKVTERDSQWQSSTPFSGWKRSGLAQSMSVSPQPTWNLPIPSSSQSPRLPKRELGTGPISDVEDIPEHRSSSIPSHNVIPAEDESMPTTGQEVDAQKPAEVQDSIEEVHAEEPVRRRGGRRRAARQATEALRKALRPEEESSGPSIPGGFPMEEDATPLAQPTPRRSARRSTRRSRKSTTATAETATPDNISTSMSMYPELPGSKSSNTPRLPRSSTTSETTAYPQHSLARLEAISDVRPIARRTRAQTAELESHGSQINMDVGDVSEAADIATSVPATPSRARGGSTRERTSTPQRVTRSTRRLRDGRTATPGASHASSTRH